MLIKVLVIIINLWLLVNTLISYYIFFLQIMVYKIKKLYYSIIHNYTISSMHAQYNLKTYLKRKIIIKFNCLLNKSNNVQ